MLKNNQKTLFFAIICCVFCLIVTIILHVSFTYILYQNALKYEEQTLKNMVDNVCIIIDTTREELSTTRNEYGEPYTDEEIKQKITNILHEQFYTFSYENNSYLWINEVHNYNGGENYGIRLIHPNLKDTEGYPLSTFTLDAKGNSPYLEELNLMKEEGSGFYSYYFKNLIDDEITEKITYARLYKDYNWIICIGIPYQTILNNVLFNHPIFKYSIAFGYGLSLLGLLISIFQFIKLYKQEELDFEYKTNVLQKQIDIDVLTKAYSRDYGMRLLKKKLELCKFKNFSSYIAIFDIDKFKNVNDTFGHDCGDIVLQRLVQIIKKHIREEDKLIRWGGDEFIIVFDNLKEKKIDFVMNKLNKYVSDEVFNFPDGICKTSISIGVSNFSIYDKSIEPILERADKALYKAKEKRNTYSCNLVEK